MATQKSQYHLSEVFTPEMRDRQARGKDPYFKVETSEDSDTSDDGPMRLGRGGYVPFLMPFLLLVLFSVPQNVDNAVVDKTTSRTGCLIAFA